MEVIIKKLVFQLDGNLGDDGLSLIEPVQLIATAVGDIVNSKENSIYLVIRRNTSLSDDFLGIRSGLRIWVVKSTSVDDYI